MFFHGLPGPALGALRHLNSPQFLHIPEKTSVRAFSLFLGSPLNLSAGIAEQPRVPRGTAAQLQRSSFRIANHQALLAIGAPERERHECGEPGCSVPERGEFLLCQIQLTGGLVARRSLRKNPAAPS
jgi:hypothetical protein